MSTPLFRRFPSLVGRIPFIDLVGRPTPLTKHQDLGEAVGYSNFYIKHDDKSAPEYGGNKPRKLEILLAEAKHKGARAVVTMGGIGTNHGLATAVYARKLGLECHLALFDQPVTEYVKRNLLLFHRYKAVCHYAGGYAKTAWIVAKEIARTSLSPEGGTYLIPGGGSNALGCLGFIDAALELEEQVAAGLMPPPRFIFCAVGSCGTYAGLLAGLKLTSLRPKVIGVRVVDRIVVNVRAIVKYANGALDLLRKNGADIGDAHVTQKDVKILQDFFGGEYGRVTPEGRDAVLRAADYGIKLETTYTGKTFAGMTSFLSGKSDRLGPALFWNTYNSVDLSAELMHVSPLDLPANLRRFFEK